MQNNSNLKYFSGTIKPQNISHIQIEQKLDNISSNVKLNLARVSTQNIQNTSTVDVVQQQIIPETNQTEQQQLPIQELYTIEKDNQDRIEKILFYRLNAETNLKELAYIEFFNYDNITERDIASSLYKPNDKGPKEQVFEENLIGNRFYKNSINAKHIDKSDYLTNVRNFKNCHENIILESNTDIRDANGDSFKKEVDYESFLYEFFNNEFKNIENNKISGKYFKSLIAYQIIQDKIEKEQNKQEEIIRSILKNEELKTLNDIEGQLTTKLNELDTIEKKLIKNNIDVSNLKNTNNTNTEKDPTYIAPFGADSSSESAQQEIEESEEKIKKQIEIQLIKQRKNLIKERNKLQSEKIEEIKQLRTNILNNKLIKLTEEQSKILNKQNNKTLYFDNLLEMRNSNDEYFKKLCNNYQDESQGDNITKYFLNELLLEESINKEQIIIMPIDLNAHATVMLIDTQSKKSYLFDSSLYNCEYNKAKVQNELFKQYADEIDLLNKNSIQINGCCTYWSMSFINTIVNNENCRYNTIEQIKEASLNGQLQLDVAIEMGKIFDSDQNNPTIKHSDNGQDINEEQYIKVKLNDNNFYGINKNAFDNKFLKLEGIKEYCSDRINTKQQMELYNVMKCQQCICKENDIFKNKEDKEYSLYDKNILTINDFINVLQNDIENKLKSKDEKEKDIQALKEIENKKIKIKEQMKEQMQQEKNTNELITQYNNKLKEQQTIFDNYNLKSYNCNIQNTRQSDDYTEKEQSTTQTQLPQTQLSDEEIRQKIAEEYKCFNKKYTEKVLKEENTKQQQLDITNKKIEKTIGL